mgnify:CR=1 FL=1
MSADLKDLKDPKDLRLHRSATAGAPALPTPTNMGLRTATASPPTEANSGVMWTRTTRTVGISRWEQLTVNCGRTRLVTEACRLLVLLHLG